MEIERLRGAGVTRNAPNMGIVARTYVMSVSSIAPALREAVGAGRAAKAIAMMRLLLAAGVTRIVWNTGIVVPMSATGVG